VLDAVIPAMRDAAASTGHLSAREVAEFGARDVALRRTCREPVEGRVAGIADDGALLVETPGGIRRFLDGSLVLAGVW
jgi:biotin-(acetyl-CoA carboxylase) ligase